MKSPTPPPSGDPRPSAPNNCILFVEDDEADFVYAGHELRKLKITNPIRCVTRTEQLLNYLAGVGEYGDRVRYPFPRLIFMDIGLPDGSGVNAQAILRASVEYRDIPVIIISTDERVRQLSSAVTLGASGFLTKPFSGADFVEILRAQGIQLEVADSI